MWGIFGDWRRFRHSRCYFCRARQPRPDDLQILCKNCGAEWRPGGDDKGYWVRRPSSVVTAELNPREEATSQRTKREVDYFTDKLVMALVLGPLIPWMMGLFGQDRLPSGGEIPGLLLLAAFFWAIGFAIAWHVGGRIYIVECICWGLMLMVLLPWLFVAFGQETVPAGRVMQRVVVSTLVVLVVVAALTRAFRTWPFERQETRRSRHVAAVLYADPAGVDAPYLARCKCGWRGELHKTEAAAIEEAERHTPNVAAHWSEVTGALH